MWIRIALVFFTLGVIVSSGCIKRVERQTRLDSKRYFPLNKGDEYHYSGKIGQIAVTNVIGSLYTLTYYDSTGEISKWEDYLKDEAGVTLKNIVWNSSEIPSIHFEPALPFSPWSNVVGDTLLFSAVGIRGDSANTHLPILVQYEVVATETISTTAGNFTDCIKIRMFLSTLNSGAAGRLDGESFWWFANDVGLVKYQSPEGSGELRKARVGGQDYP